MLQLEMLALRHQLHLLERSRPRRVHLTPADRLLWVGLSRVWWDWRAVVIVKPDTILSWHGRGFRLAWTWKSRRRGRPTVAAEVDTLIRTMSETNLLCGAPRIHGELLKLGITISQAAVAKYMGAASAPTLPDLAHVSRQSGYADDGGGFLGRPDHDVSTPVVILAHDRRRVVHVAVTAYPTAAWTAQQLREAFPEDHAARYLLHDRDSAFAAVGATAAGMGIREVRTAPQSRGKTRTLSA
jgi:hypothetical protein